MTTDTAKAYWSKPCCVRIETSHFSGTSMFDDASDAFKYLADQFVRVDRIIKTREYGSAWVNFDCYRSTITTPAGTYRARDVMFVDKLASS